MDHQPITHINDGAAAHRAWEAIRGAENECDAEHDIAERAMEAGADMTRWWAGWFERSDEWRDEIGYDARPSLTRD